MRCKHFLITFRSLHIYLPSQTFSFTWRAKWCWKPTRTGRLYHWGPFLFSRRIFPEGDYGEKASEDFAAVLSVLHKHLTTKDHSG